MKGILAIVFLFVSVHLSYAKTGDLERFFAAYKTKSVESLDEAIAYFNDNSDNHKAYVAALMMKKAGVVKGAAEKLNLFKEGKKMLEALIKKSPRNLEWRFLRLTVQENAPDILGYNDDVQEDTDLIYQNYGKAPAELQKVIKQYASKSDVLEASKL